MILQVRLRKSNIKKKKKKHIAKADGKFLILL